MPIQVACSSCKSTFNAPDGAAGKTARCPKCNGVIQIPAPTAAEEIVDAEEVSDVPIADEGNWAAESAAKSPADGDRKPCPMCGETIQKEAVKCRFCGEIFDQVLANAERRRGPGPVPGESVEAAARRLMAEQQDKTTALQIFLTGLIGCFSPILAIYGIVFLVRRPYPFPRKGLAIAGTVLHCIWLLPWLVYIAAIVMASLDPNHR